MEIEVIEKRIKELYALRDRIDTSTNQGIRHKDEIEKLIQVNVDTYRLLNKDYSGFELQ